jgi:predicted metal-binding membrane protein
MSADNALGKPRDRALLSLDARTLTVGVVSLSTVAWLVMLMLHGGGHGLSPALTLSWLSGWFIMVMAMMLPPALPFLQALQRLTSGLPKGAVMVASAAVAFLMTWTLAGIFLVTTGHLFARWLTDFPWLVDRPMVLSGVAAILVGAYQLSPLKQACLTACRSPVALMLVAWEDRHPWRSALTIGMRYALVCIGCCWTLMLLTLVVGAFVLPLMMMVSVIMLLERLLPSVRPLVPIQAALACAIGILLLLGSLPPGLDLGGSGISTHHMMRQ